MRKPVQFRNTVLDRLVGVFDPEAQLRRIHARARIDAVGSMGGYIGGRRDRRPTSQWRTTRGSADADLLPDLEVLRERCRDLVRNSPIAGGAISTVVTSVVGTGLKLQSQIDRKLLGLSDDEVDAWQRNTEREWRLWAESQDCDITRTQDFYGLQDMVMRSTLESGDCFSVLPYVARRGTAYDLRVQIIEADRVRNKDWHIDTNTLAGGVEIDQYGAPKNYHILRTHPGSIFPSPFIWDVIPAFGANTGRRNVLHHYWKKRPGQNRGVPYLAPVVELVKQLTTYSEAEIDAAVISSFFTVFVKSESGGLNTTTIPGLANETGQQAGDDDIKLGKGLVVDLKPNEDISTAQPGRPNVNFDPFFQAIIRQMGVALEIPFEVLIKHFTASYSAARAALQEAWKFYRGRRAWLVTTFCQPIYEAWMEEAVASGRIEAPGFFDDPAIRMAYLGCVWNGDAMPQIDPVKEVEAARGRIELGISDRQQETAALTGGDWEQTHQQQAREAKMRREDGLDPFVPKLPTITAPDPTDGGDNELNPASPAQEGR